MMKEILLIGGGGHCQSVIDVIEQEDKYRIAGIIDKKELIGQEVLGYKVIGCDDDLEALFKTYKYALVTVGQITSNQLRVKLFTMLKKIGYELAVIVSPLAYVSRHALLAEGTVVMHHALVSVNVRVGQNCIINTKALLEHDVSIEAHCHISTATVLNGGVVVKENTFVGSNSTTKEYVELNGFIKAGGVIK
ncbi:MAG: 4-amino-6-deoxy-N-Acetyl-D-hexosaminyl-(Lipid carrier) acetyltrasferase [uncultured Sulfurovum sp.]|uniref:4-amino-6-deoxy-N-Acetyl-D-hexosaminyl-(Lipid carrier) acetyltrasferase n=1 Tax=uncultured Sulfurovum sp. TaxID=269237 RepID=A0A6S6TJR7_9BACT|nr:MAG: 4-amino-6-deoxy-N-Acetyl-D-hexosaminyl-(Lipid carrier) acetyltrasferase [uncultured Sulfurovum sp.]